MCGVGVAAVLSSGCAAIPNRTIPIEISSDPPGLEIWSVPDPEKNRNYGFVKTYEGPGQGVSPILIGKTPYNSEWSVGWGLIFGRDVAGFLPSIRSKIVVFPFLFEYGSSTVGIRYMLRGDGIPDTVIREPLSDSSTVWIIFTVGMTGDATRRRAVAALPGNIKRHHSFPFRTPAELVAPAATVVKPAFERLRQLEQLHKNGLMSDSEYETKRKSIIDDL